MLAHVVLLCYATPQTVFVPVIQCEFISSFLVNNHSTPKRAKGRMVVAEDSVECLPRQNIRVGFGLVEQVQHHFCLWEQYIPQVAWKIIFNAFQDRNKRALKVRIALSAALR